MSKKAAAKFAEEFPSDDPVVVLPAATLPQSNNTRLGTKKLPHLELQQPVEVVDGDAASEERVVLGDNLRPTPPPGSDFSFVEAEAVQEYDVVEAQRVNSVVVSDERERPLKWHQKTFYRAIVIGSIILVGAIIVAVVLVTNSKKQQQATVQGPASLTPSPPSPTQGPTVDPSTLEQMQIACDFLDVSLNTCPTLTTFGSAVVGTSIPSEIALLTQLTNLALHKRDLRGSIPSSIGTMTQLVNLILEDNQLTGTIPSSLGSLTLLTNLSLARNNLSGTIPPSIASLTKLLYLWLYDNKLSGIISSIGNLIYLQQASLSDNFFVGKIPDSFGNIRFMVKLSLFNNSLTGSLPNSLGSITLLERLLLYDNALTGSLPDSFGSLTKLTELAIFNNDMSSINFPSNLCSTGSTLYYVDCQSPPDDNICSCCPNNSFNATSCT